MSGLFARLARHAVGQPHNPVRAALPMPYQQSSELASKEQVYPQLTAESTLTGIDAQSDARTKASIVDKSGRLQAPDFSEQQGSDHIEAQPMMSDLAGDPQVPRHAIDPISQTVDLAAVTTGLESSAAFDQLQDHDTQTVTAASVTDKNLIETLADNQPRNLESYHQQQTSPEDASPVESKAPELLLPSLAAAPTANSVAAMQTPAAISGSPNEVHVHIGSIEVTAVRSSEPRKRKVKVAQQPMSLDDYLVRQRRGRR